jgi:hypothetical protein
LRDQPRPIDDLEPAFNGIKREEASSRHRTRSQVSKGPVNQISPPMPAGRPTVTISVDVATLQQSRANPEPLHVHTGRGPLNALQPLEAGDAKHNVFAVEDDVNSALRRPIAFVADQARAVLVGDGAGRVRAGSASLGRLWRQSSSPEIDWLRAVRRSGLDHNSHRNGRRLKQYGPSSRQ